MLEVEFSGIIFIIPFWHPLSLTTDVSYRNKFYTDLLDREQIQWQLYLYNCRQHLLFGPVLFANPSMILTLSFHMDCTSQLTWDGNTIHET